MGEVGATGFGGVKLDQNRFLSSPDIDLDPRLLNDRPICTGNLTYEGKPGQWYRDSEVMLMWVLIHEGGHIAEQIPSCNSICIDANGMDAGDYFEVHTLGIDLANPSDFVRLRNTEYRWDLLRTPRANPDPNAPFYGIFSDLTQTRLFLSGQSSTSSIRNTMKHLNSTGGNKKMTSYGNDRYLD